MRTANDFIAVGFLVLSSLCASPASAQPVWERLAGPFGGPALSIVDAGDGRMLAATVGTDQYLGWVYESMDNGRSWSETGLAVFGEGRAVSRWSDTGFCVGLTPWETDAGRGAIICKDGERREYRSFPGGVLALAPTAEGTIYIGTESGLYRASDDARFDVEEIRTDMAIGALEITNDLENVIVGTFAGLYECADDCSAWRLLGLADQSIFSLDVLDRRDLLIGTSNGLYRLQAEALSHVGFADTNVAAVAHIDQNHWFVGSDSGIHATNDGGSTFTEVPATTGRIYALAAGASRVIAGAARGIFDVDPFTRTSNLVGVANSYITALESDASGLLYAGTLDRGLFRSADGGSTFESTELGDRWVTAAASDSRGRLLVGVFLNGAFYSEDHGHSWTHRERLTGYVRSIVFDSNNCAYAGTGVVRRSCDHGDTWTTLGDGLDASSVEKLAITRADDVLAATNNGIFALREGSSDWEHMLAACRLSSCWYYDVFEAPDGAIIALSEEQLYRSSDGGASWSATTPPSGTMSVVVEDRGRLYAATMSQGVFESVDQGATWDSMSGGLPLALGGTGHPQITAMLLDQAGHLTIGTGGYGVYRTVQKVSSGVKREVTAPSPLVPTSVFPNPAHDIAHLKITLPAAGHVEISIFDILGRKIEEVMSGYMPAGEHLVSWRGGDQPSGVYFCRIRYRDSFTSATIVLE